MGTLAFLAVALGIAVFSLASRRLGTSLLTAPMIFTGFGFVLGQATGEATFDPGHGVIHTLAEITLILVLFSDAARIDLRLLRRHHDLPVRMLAIGLPLTVIAGTAVALALPLGLSLWPAALLAAILAPTDAALGQSVIASNKVPMRVRQAFNIESGLNDGIALPLVLLFFSLTAMSAHADGRNWVMFILGQVALGPLAGLAVGWAAARLIDLAVVRNWMEQAYQGPAILAAAFIAYSLSTVIGGNGFIAAFVAGAVFGNLLQHRCTYLFEFAESEGHLLVLFSFLFFGAALLPEALPNIGPAEVVYAVASLTVVRMVPVALSLLGMGLKLLTVLFLGWFGPRGLASILFALFVLEEASFPGSRTVQAVVMLTCGLSIVLHGLTAAPAAAKVGAYIRRQGELTETEPVEPMRSRFGELKNDANQNGQTGRTE